LPTTAVAFPEVSIVIPCLNEEGSLEECVQKVRAAFQGMTHEIIVADNGSTDKSKEIAHRANARVVEERRRGYGSAILCGMREARGEFVVVGDADNTYDFEDGRMLVNLLKERNADFGIGNRIGGKVDEGAMPWLHKHLGTPVLSFVLSRFFGCRVHDINCGLRAIRRTKLQELKLRSPGMEFASEMVIHAQKAGLKFAEAPIRYYRRHHGQAKLRTFRDGWRHLRFILLCAPFPLYFLPALALIVASVFLYQQERLGLQVMASLLTTAAFQLIVFAAFAKAYLWIADSFMLDRRAGKFLARFKLEHGILMGLACGLGGILFVQKFDLANLIRGSTLLALAVQIIFSSFFLSTILSKGSRDTL